MLWSLRYCHFRSEFCYSLVVAINFICFSFHLLFVKSLRCEISRLWLRFKFWCWSCGISHFRDFSDMIVAHTWRRFWNVFVCKHSHQLRIFINVQWSWFNRYWLSFLVWVHQARIIWQLTHNPHLFLALFSYLNMSSFLFFSSYFIFSLLTFFFLDSSFFSFSFLLLFHLSFILFPLLLFFFMSLLLLVSLLFLLKFS